MLTSSPAFTSTALTVTFTRRARGAPTLTFNSRVTVLPSAPCAVSLYVVSALGDTSTQRASAADNSRRGGSSHTAFAFSTPEHTSAVPPRPPCAVVVYAWV